MAYSLLINYDIIVSYVHVEHILREEKMMAGQEIVELFCALIVVRLPIIKA